MKFATYILAAGLALAALPAAAEQKGDDMDREQRANATYEALFASKRGTSPTDPEFMEILQKLIFGEVFYIGELDNKTRELVTVASLTALQALPQLKGHIGAALNAGNSPLEVRETIYQCAPFIGFPRTLNAIAAFNETMAERGIALPLEDAAAVNDENRLAEGLKIQQALYGDEVKAAMQALPGEFNEAVPQLLTEFCFADFYTRKGLSLKQRELLSLAVLTALGAEKQLKAHVIGNLKAGNSKETLLAAMVQAAPYIGLPQALTAIELIKNADMANYRPIYE